MRPTTVIDVMTGEVITAAPTSTVEDIGDLLQRNDISAVPVVDERGVPLGVVSGAELAGGRGATAEAVMTAAPTVDVEATLPGAARLLAAPGARRLFVCRDGLVVGVVARRDLLRWFLREDGEIKNDIDRHVLGGVLNADPSMVGSTVEDGVVTLTGQLRYESDVAAAIRLCRAVAGVVRVTSRLDYLWNGEGSHTDHSAGRT
jgi:CBS domain-containing protein